MKSFASICAILCAICAEAAATAITTDAPGWVFRDTEKPVFHLLAEEVESQKSKAESQEDLLTSLYDRNNPANPASPVKENLCATEPPCETTTAWTLRDWRGRELASGEWPADGRLALAPLPPGYYSIDGRGFMVVDASVPPNPDSFFAADSAFTMWAKRGEFDCPWYGGDSFRVVAELMGLCGVSHTRERMLLFRMAPAQGVFDFDGFLPYLQNARLMKRNGTQCLGLFGDTPAWMGVSAKRRMPRDLMALYRFMERAVVEFGDCFDAWEYWNEQDLSASAGPVWEYAATLKAFSLGMAAGDPAKPALPGSVSAVDHQGFCQGMFDNDIAKYVDAFNLHTYENPASFPKWTAGVRRFLEEAGVPDFQVWLTEFGTNLEGHGKSESGREGILAHSPEQELKMAEICPKGMILLQFGGIYRAWWFLFGCYNERHGEKDWGTMRRDGSVKPICAALATLNRLLGGAKMLGEVKVGEGICAFLYETENSHRDTETQRIHDFETKDLSTDTLCASVPLCETIPSAHQTLVFWRESDVDTGRQTDVSPADKDFTIPAADGDYPLVDVMGTPRNVAAEGGTLRLTATAHPQFATGLSGLSPDIPATPSGTFGRKPAESDEDLTVVVRPHLPPGEVEIGGRHCLAELLNDTCAIELELWNFSSEAKTGRVVAEGGELRGIPASITLPPFGKVDIKAEYMPPNGDSTDFTLTLRFAADDGRVSTCAKIPFFHRKRFLSKCEIVPWPALNNPAAWRRNDSADEYRCTYDEAEGAVRFDVEWKPWTSRGAWFFPVHDLKLPEESMDGGRMLEFEVKSDQDKVENDFYEVVVMALYADGQCRYLPYLRPYREWGIRRAVVPADADKIVALRFGGTPAGRRLSYWIRNVRLLK